MTTGVEHKRLVEISVPTEGSEERRSYVKCRCTIGADHDDPEVFISQYDPNEDEDEDEDAEDEEGEALSVYDAADIWGSKGQDEDYMFGYSEDELRRAADD
ncbi:MAG TPA: hypothetical protein VF867_18855 [Arthrobacter sp.]